MLYFQYMEPETKNKLQELESKIDAIWTSVEKTRKYILVSVWISVIVFVLPLLALAVVIPKMLSSYLDILGGI